MILFCDNLKAHVNYQVGNIFGEEKLLLFYLSKNMIELVQPTNSGYGWLLRCNIGKVLDIWLVSEENLSKWEGNMIAAECRILVTKLISDTQEEILNEKNYSQQQGCFLRTGCLITTLVTP